MSMPRQTHGAAGYGSVTSMVAESASEIDKVVYRFLDQDSFVIYSMTETKSLRQKKLHSTAFVVKLTGPWAPDSSGLRH